MSIGSHQLNLREREREREVEVFFVFSRFSFAKPENSYSLK